MRPGPGDSGPGFEPALSLKTRVLRVRSVPEGAKVGYAATWTAPRPSRLATLAIGYDDGLPRSLSGRGEVLIGECDFVQDLRASKAVELFAGDLVDNAKAGDAAQEDIEAAIVEPLLGGDAAQAGDRM